ARVIARSGNPLLDATFRDWGALVSYLGEQLAPADAAPMSVPLTRLPDTPPPPVAERLSAVHVWWEFFHRQLATLNPRTGPLPRLVPNRWQTDDVAAQEEPVPREVAHREILPPDLLERIGRLWGAAVLPREPAVIITQTHPFWRFAEILQPAAQLWEEL